MKPFVSRNGVKKEKAVITISLYGKKISIVTMKKKKRKKKIASNFSYD